jgi:hypothetical protein
MMIVMMKVRKMMIVMRRMSRSAQKSKVLAIKMRKMMTVSIKMSKCEKNDDCDDES